ncbi:MAG: hypothetical protein HC874_27295 [Richelia sp. SL_2_1]|nr:hypothetical protein [Richelia sp. SL_2_1]
MTDIKIKSEKENFTDTYTSTTLAEQGKTALEDGTFALCNLIAKLIDKIEHARLSWR